MASKRDMEMGREFAGNGASSFDARDWRAEARELDLTPRIPGALEAIAAAEAQIARAFSPEAHAKWLANQAAKAGRAAA